MLATSANAPTVFNKFVFILFSSIRYSTTFGEKCQGKRAALHLILYYYNIGRARARKRAKFPEILWKKIKKCNEYYKKKFVEKSFEKILTFLYRKWYSIQAVAWVRRKAEDDPRRQPFSKKTFWKKIKKFKKAMKNSWQERVICDIIYKLSRRKREARTEVRI